jgi:hypothetical protein
MADEPKAPKPEEIKKKDTILIVEDNEAVGRVVYESIMKAQFPDHEIIRVVDMESAVSILQDSDKNVVAAVIDNGFPLIEGGDRKGKTRNPQKEEGVEISPLDPDEKYKMDKEGGAGTMLIRYIRTGTFGALANRTLKEVAEFGELKTLPDKYKDMPIAWNSASPEAGKVATVKAASAGQEIDPQSSIFTDTTVKIPKTELETLDAHTVATDKFGIKNIALFFKEQFAQKAQEAQSEPPSTTWAERSTSRSTAPGFPGHP